MSCCNFRNNRYDMRRRYGRYSCDDRRGCSPVNWGPCRDNRYCPRRSPYRPGFRWPF